MLLEVSEILKIANDDILLEVFLRLPSCRDAILAGSVCRHWNSIISHAQFIPMFIAFHQDHYYSKPYTIIFHKADNHVFHVVDYYQPFCKILSDESNILHGKVATAPSSYFDFMPSPMIIRASFDDLLLVSPGRHSCIDLYVCNPVTKRYLQLPKPLEDCCKGIIIGFSLLCTSSNYSNNNSEVGSRYQFKVVLINMYKPLGEVECPFLATVFCSESGEWSISRFSVPPPAKHEYSGTYVDVVTCNGVIYWLDGHYHCNRIIALDLFNNRCRVIGFPDDFGSGLCKFRVEIRLGVIEEELRLLKCFRFQKRPVIKIWKLKYCKDFVSTRWDLIHERNIERPDVEEIVSVVFHPRSDRVVFMLRDTDVVEFDIVEGTFRKTGDLQESLGLALHEQVGTTTLVHPFWPRPVRSTSF